jgi:hypothetical protein
VEQLELIRPPAPGTPTPTTTTTTPIDRLCKSLNNFFSVEVSAVEVKPEENGLKKRNNR